MLARIHSIDIVEGRGRERPRTGSSNECVHEEPASMGGTEEGGSVEDVAHVPSAARPCLVRLVTGAFYAFVPPHSPLEP